MLESQHRSYRFFAGRNSTVRAHGVERVSKRQALCARDTTEPVRFDASSQGLSHGMGLLSCAKQQRLRHDQPNRVSNREVCAGIWRSHPCAEYQDAGRTTTAQCESGGWRYLWWSEQLDAAFSSSNAPRVRDTLSRIVSLLVFHSARGRSARNVWLSRRCTRAGGWRVGEQSQKSCAQARCGVYVTRNDFRAQ